MAKFFLGVLVGMVAVVGLILGYEQVMAHHGFSYGMPFYESGRWVFPRYVKPPPMKRVEPCEFERVPVLVVPEPVPPPMEEVGNKEVVP